MQFFKTLILSVAALFSLFQPHPAVPAKNQVLGETTAQQMTIWKAKIKEELGCDYETTCRDYCKKPENAKKCDEFFSHNNPQTVAGAPGGEDVNPESSTRRPTANPTQHTEDDRGEPRSSSSSESSESETVSYGDLKQLTATNPAALKRQLQEAYNYIKKSNAANKNELLQKLYSEYRAVIAHEEDHINTTAGTVDTTAAAEKSKDAHEKEEFRTHLAQIRNEQKKQAVEVIDAKITAINYKAVELMNSALNKLSKLLTALNNQIFALKAQSQDVLTVQTDSLDAQTAIADAQQAVLAQANKSYILPISSDEGKLKGEIGPVVSTLRNDISAVHKKVILAKDAVSKVYEEVYKLKRSVTPIVTPSTATGEGAVAH